MGMLDYLIMAVVGIVGVITFCGLVMIFVKVCDILLNEFNDRDPWK